MRVVVVAVTLVAALALFTPVAAADGGVAVCSYLGTTVQVGYTWTGPPPAFVGVRVDDDAPWVSASLSASSNPC